MKIDRRKLFAVGGAGVFAAGAGAAGPEIDLSVMGALTVKLARRYGEWCVLVPDWDLEWAVGAQIPPVKWMPLAEFLASVDHVNLSA